MWSRGPRRKDEVRDMERPSSLQTTPLSACYRLGCILSPKDPQKDLLTPDGPQVRFLHNYLKPPGVAFLVFI